MFDNGKRRELLEAGGREAENDFLLRVNNNQYGSSSLSALGRPHLCLISVPRAHFCHGRCHRQGNSSKRPFPSRLYLCYALKHLIQAKPIQSNPI